MEAAEALEARLGDPTLPDNPHGYHAITARDERDEFPTELTSALRESGFHLAYLPERLGGTFTGFEDSLVLVRTAARRDLAAMPATMFSITAAVCLLLRGSPGQLDDAARLLASGGSIGFALSEADHGSDLLANTVRLRPAGDGSGALALDGRKWLVGRGQTCESAYVVARTGERGPAAFTAVLVDLTDPECAPRVRRGPAVRTTGMRGIDFAHLDFDAFPVRPDQVVGGPGEGLESAMRAQQVVRVMSLAGSLGCADTALRATLGFANFRALGRKPLIAAGHPRRELAVAAAALLAADATALAAARGLHVAPETFSVWGGCGQARRRRGHHRSDAAVRRGALQHGDAARRGPGRRGVPEGHAGRGPGAGGGHQHGGQPPLLRRPTAGRRRPDAGPGHAGGAGGAGGPDPVGLPRRGRPAAVRAGAA
ncbi:acyl-CoA dehydrogenase family protein [Streptomyces sp. PT12]|uniref:acyl-CoA dehydrogenase family protein n=1 Tax=Streptomyces sp. PT12 TaxID=1510197 RepID=UPI00215C337B|nr:acyl-CoA dehydrogenase family protein [Streptomyces sp. PT12]